MGFIEEQTKNCGVWLMVAIAMFAFAFSQDGIPTPEEMMSPKPGTFMGYSPLGLIAVAAGTWSLLLFRLRGRYNDYYKELAAWEASNAESGRHRE